MQWLMLQHDEPVDFVIATGQQISVREFVDKTAERLQIEIEWFGTDETETGTVRSVGGKSAEHVAVGDAIVRVDPRYFRPAEVETLLGDPSLAKEKLGWVPTTTLDEMIDEMVGHDLDQAKRVMISSSRASISRSTRNIFSARSKNMDYVFVAGHRGMVGSAIVRRLPGLLGRQFLP